MGADALRAALDAVGGPALEATVDRLVARIRADVPEYAAVPDQVLRDGNRSVVLAAIGHLRAGRVPDDTELPGIIAVGADRARSGIGLSAVLAAYRVGGQELWEVLSAEARRRGADDASLLFAARLSWGWLDVVTVAAAVAHHEVELSSAREYERRTADAVRAVLEQPVSDAVGRRHLAVLDLPPDGRYAAVRGRLAAGVSMSALREVDGLVATVVDQVVLGVLVDAAGPDARLGTFGIGPSGPVAALHDSYLTAGRVHAAAARLGRAGWHRLDTLRLAATAALDAEMTAILVARLVTPLRARAGYGVDVWRSVLCHLRHGLRVEDTAEELHVHPNTLRHRLATFTELTGADPRDPADLAELWWVAQVVGPDMAVPRDARPRGTP